MALTPAKCEEEGERSVTEKKEKTATKMEE